MSMLFLNYSSRRKARKTFVPVRDRFPHRSSYDVRIETHNFMILSLAEAQRS
jgi:hypothetical protein